MENNNLVPGLEFRSETMVEDADTALAAGSGDLRVFATPAMVALMENAAMNCAAQHITEGTTTVGTSISVSHIKATAVGHTVSATAKLESVEGRKLTFSVSAEDETGIIGEGSHTRFIVDREKFMSKLA